MDGGQGEGLRARAKQGEVGHLGKSRPCGELCPQLLLELHGREVVLRAPTVEQNLNCSELIAGEEFLDDGGREAGLRRGALRPRARFPGDVWSSLAGGRAADRGDEGSVGQF